MATGLLVLGVGEGTKLLHYAVEGEKRYTATLHLGVETDSLDADGAVQRELPVPEGLTLASVAAAARGFEGPLRQRAPAVSAIKQGGEALYKKARRGEIVEAPVRDVVLHAVEVLRVEGAEVDLDLRCAKGFYVRAFGRDLAERLGTVGHLTRLRRLGSGGFDVADAVSMAALEAAADDGEARARLLSTLLPLPEAARACLPAVELDGEGATHLRHGRVAALSHVVGEAPAVGVPLACMDSAGALVAIGELGAEGLRVRRGFSSAP